MGLSVLRETLPQSCSFRTEKEEPLEMGVSKKDNLVEICKNSCYSVIPDRMVELSKSEGFQSKAVIIKS